MTHHSILPDRRVSLPTAHCCAARNRRGISLIEVLISMFVLLFGLMGVAAIFPVGNHYAAQGDRFDRSTALIDNAFAELNTRGLLRPDRWVFNADGQANQTVIAEEGSRRAGWFALGASAIGAGHAFVIDPLGYAAGFEDDAEAANLDLFPRWRLEGDPDGMLNDANPWTQNGPNGQPVLSGTRWPIRRVTYFDLNRFTLPTAVAETVFSLRDDLAVEVPVAGDRPGIQRWASITEQQTGTNPGTTIPLARDFARDYTWLATVVPTGRPAREALQSNDRAHGSYLVDVSVVVFRKRDPTPLPASERAIEGRMLAGGELVIFANNVATVDAAVEEVRAGEWLAVAGVHPQTATLILKWYRILAIDNTTDTTGTLPTPNNESGRRLMLDGPAWPEGALPEVRAILLPGAVSAATRPLTLNTTN